MKDIKTSMMLYQGEQFETDDLDNRRLYINGIIDSDVIDTIVYHILRYNREDKDIPVKSRKPILLYKQVFYLSLLHQLMHTHQELSLHLYSHTIRLAFCF